MIKVLLERRVTKKNYDKLRKHLLDLRAATVHQPGYISGETLVRGDDPRDVLIISTWLSEEHWNAWINSEKRIALNNTIESLIDGEAKVSIYLVPFGEDED